ncbi:MAG: response regulator [Francisellaceae bacterium]|nr:response regulator [Francisellaceae bacterium]MBT6207481.1 response regulator [Francisellaceae bacterium]MBT6539662.1 response regulator [Francisellaceae bacterium]
MSKDISILIVDDFSTMRRIIKNLLRDLGYENTDDADDGDSGLKKLETGKFDLLITDWVMPNVSGADFVRKIRQHSLLNNIPVLIVTGDIKREIILDAMTIGINDYLKKPFNSEVLLSRIERVFKRVSETTR